MSKPDKPSPQCAIHSSTQGLAPVGTQAGTMQKAQPVNRGNTFDSG